MKKRESVIALLGRGQPGEGKPIRLLDLANIAPLGGPQPFGECLGLPGNEGAIHEVKRLGRSRRQSALADHQARIGEIKQGERLEDLIPENRQVDRPVRVGVVQAGDTNKRGQSLTGTSHGRPDRRLQCKPASDEERGIANRLGLEPALAHPPDKRVIGVGLIVAIIVSGSKLVRPAEDNPAN